MFVVKVCNNNGRFKEWDIFPFEDQALHERDLLIAENNFWPADVLVEKITGQSNE